VKKINRIVRRRRKPGEYATGRLAIRLCCLECMGYQPREVSRCTARECWLWPLRDPNIPPERQIADEDGVSSFDDM